MEIPWVTPFAIPHSNLTGSEVEEPKHTVAVKISWQYAWAYTVDLCRSSGEISESDRRCSFCM
jgi:hypothetical protein